LVDYVTMLTPTTTNNVYKQPSEPTVVQWGEPGRPETWSSAAQCSSFLVAVLRHAYPWVDDAYLTQVFGAVKPTARSMYNAFAGTAELPHLQRIDKVVDLRPGDLIAIDYRNGAATNTGHAVMVRQVLGPYDRKLNLPDTVQYAVQIADCTSEPHGVIDKHDYEAFPDTRIAPTVEQQGIGYGHMMFYAKSKKAEGEGDDVLGRFAGYRWSVNTNADGTHAIDERPIAAVRVVAP
jgi:hypothetical protein